MRPHAPEPIHHLVALAALLLVACSPGVARHTDAPSPNPTAAPSLAGHDDAKPDGAAMEGATAPMAFTPHVSLTGEAQDAKGGAVLLLGPGQAPIYLQGIDRWEGVGRGTTVTVEGHLTHRAYLPEAEALEGGIITQGVEPGSRQWVLDDPRVVPAEIRPAAAPFALMRAAWPEHARCLDAVAAALGSPERAGEFCVATTVRRQDGRVAFGLWHRSAFLPENEGITGNPGGQSRDALCDPDAGTFDRFLFWQ